MSTFSASPLLAIVILGICISDSSALLGKETSHSSWRFTSGGIDVSNRSTSQDVAKLNVSTQVSTTPAIQGLVETSIIKVRTELISGARYTVFADFLQEKPGSVQLEVHGVRIACEIIQWQSYGVTITLPMLGMNHPKQALFRIIRSDGRVAKLVPVVLKSPPDFFLHEDPPGLQAVEPNAEVIVPITNQDSAHRAMRLE